MAKIDIKDLTGAVKGSIELSDEIFGIEPNADAMSLVVRNQLANRRQGTQKTKTRSEVSGGGKRPYRQKGTGRARHGSTRSAQYVGGGIIFGPKPRDYSYTVPKKIRRLAMQSALSSKDQENEIIVLEDLKFEEPKTKEMVKVLANVNAEKKALIVTAEKDDNVVRSAANIPGVRTALVGTMNVYEIINHNSLILTKDAVAKIEEVYA